MWDWMPTSNDRTTPLHRQIFLVDTWMISEARKGRRADLGVVAITLLHGLTVVTRNTADFAGCGVTLLNPWAL